MIEKTRRVVRSGSATSDITYIVFQCFIGCDVLALKLKALQFYDILIENNTWMEWDAKVQKLKTKYQSLKYQSLWSPKAMNTKENPKTSMDFMPRLTR